MARPKEFDRTLVLEKAMETFWEHGYAGTSMQALLTAMGLNRGSLYATFGDKRSLFLEAVAHYDAQVVNAAIAKLEAPNAGKAAIINHFHTMLDCLDNPRTPWGCLMTNMAVEQCNQDAKTRQQIQASLQRVERAFAQALRTAQVQGEIAADADIPALASGLICMGQGLRVMMKVKRDRATLERMIETMLTVL
jgi:TetR/AcrR family transcriptional repressor of nem operon